MTNRSSSHELRLERFSRADRSILRELLTDYLAECSELEGPRIAG